MYENKKIRKCLYSGEDFIPRRNNQIFANKKNRIAYHNDRNNKTRNDLKDTNKHLMINYKVCNDILNGQKTKSVHREYLKGMGFDFRFFTNMVTNKANTAYAYVIYDASFEKVDDTNYLITKL